MERTVGFYCIRFIGRVQYPEVFGICSARRPGERLAGTLESGELLRAGQWARDYVIKVAEMKAYSKLENASALFMDEADCPRAQAWESARFRERGGQRVSCHENGVRSQQQ